MVEVCLMMEERGRGEDGCVHVIILLRCGASVTSHRGRCMCVCVCVCVVFSLS